MAAFGSPEYELTWKRWDIASGPPICALRGSERPTSGSGSTGWPTPNAQEFGAANMDGLNARRKKYQEKYGNNGFGLTLGQCAQVTGYPTTKASDGAKGGPRQTGGDLPADAAAMMGLTGYPTPRTKTGGPESAERKRELGREESGGGDLESHALSMTGWATPNAWDCQGSNGGGQGKSLRTDAQETVHGATRPSGSGQTAPRGALNPEFSRWLSGFPEEWGCCGATAMRLSRRSRRSS